MTLVCRCLTVAALTLASGAAAAEAGAQMMPGMYQPRLGGRVNLDGYLSRHRLALGPSRVQLGGVGARAMFSFAPATGVRRETLAQHLALGAFVGTSDDAATGNRALRSTLYGVQLDVRPLRAAVAGVLEPIVSIGAGGMRLTRSHTEMAYRLEPMRLPNGEPLLPRDVPPLLRPVKLTERATYGILAPAVGVLLNVGPDFAIRLDFRSLLSREDGVGSELAAGVSVRL